MELGHILWPSDPVTRESSDPETQLTRWPCSIMNYKCRLMLQTNVCNGQEVCQFLSLFGVCTLLESKILTIIYCQYFNDGWTDFHKNIYRYIVILGFFRKPEKLGSHTGSKWWPGDPDVKDDPNDPLTRWPNDPVSCLVAKCKRTLSDLIQQDFKSRRSCCISNEIQVDFVFDNCVSRHRLNLKHCMISDRAKYLSQMSSRLKVIVKAWLYRTLDMKMK